MKTLDICGNKLLVKDYHCAAAGDYFRLESNAEYISKPELKLWLYVNVTDSCNANCVFCVNKSSSCGNNRVSAGSYRQMLDEVKENIYGISFTGGEPMLFPELLDELIGITSEVMPSDVEVDLVTNGTNLGQLLMLENIERLATIHISRHSFDDKINNRLMGFEGPSYEEIKDFISKLKDPGKVVFNCVLQRGGVACCEDVARYLDMAIDSGVQNSSFITMIKANSYCDENYINVFSFPIVSDQEYAAWNEKHLESKFDVWNRNSDYDFCHCLSGGYENTNVRTRFYFRCPGTQTSPNYCRQLVYTAKNTLQDGFGDDRTEIRFK